MNGSSLTDELLLAMRSLRDRLRQRGDLLSRLASTSDELHRTLSTEPDADVGSILQRRQAECDSLAEVRGSAGDDLERLIGAARDAAERMDDAGDAARTALAINRECASLADRVMSRQSECEELLRSRLETTTRALRQSVHRRKLDAAYGPAVRHSTPAFIDKQR